jgi:hypothetical protein
MNIVFNIGYKFVRYYVLLRKHDWGRSIILLNDGGNDKKKMYIER